MKVCATPDCPNTDFYAKNIRCKTCSSKSALARYFAKGGTSAYTEGQRLRRSHLSKIRERASRSDPDKRAYYIWRDSRQSDRRKGLDNDLTKEDIQRLIAHPCSYCGESKLKKTLDRINNELGHTHANVVVACVRCNYMRRDMPYEAWLQIVPGIVRAKEMGLFGGWTGEIHKKQWNAPRNGP